jgi:protein phosphatase
LIVGVLAVLVVALGGAYAWTQSQYFVGRDGAEVAIFQGVNTEFGPLKFFNVYKNSDLMVADLNPSVRSQVTDGITARSERDAEKIIENLRGQQLPICPTATPTPTTPTPTPTTSTPTGTKKSTPASAKKSTPVARGSRTPTAASTTKLVTLPSIEVGTPTPGQQCRSGP